MNIVRDPSVESRDLTCDRQLCAAVYAVLEKERHDDD
jgi:hypothetical protein